MKKTLLRYIVFGMLAMLIAFALANIAIKNIWATRSPILQLPNIIVSLFFLWFLSSATLATIRSPKGIYETSYVSNKTLIIMLVAWLLPILNDRLFNTLPEAHLPSCGLEWVLAWNWHTFALIAICSLCLSLLYRLSYGLIHAIVAGASGSLLLESAIWNLDITGSEDPSSFFFMKIQIYMLPTLLCVLLWMICSLAIRKPKCT